MITVVLAEDQTLVREGIRSLLELVDDITVVGDAADGHDALAVIEATQPDVVLLDLRMPRMDGLATLRALGAEGPAVLVLTTFDDDDAVLEALRNGARGYLLKDVALSQLVGAIRAVARGRSAVYPGMTETLLRRLGSSQREQIDRLDYPEPLTAREVEVLRLLTGGYSNREIASVLHLSEGTVKNHVSSILLKLRVRDRTRAALRGIELGYTSPPANL